MKKNSVPTLTIGIPAYNEAGNIATLLKLLMRQKQRSYKLVAILVKCDGCTDNTAEIVAALSHTYPIIHPDISVTRSGKADALNKIYMEHNSDFLLTIDADLAFQGNMDIEYMILEMLRNPRVRVVGPRHIPTNQRTLWGKFAEASFLSFEDAFLHWKQGNNYYACMSATLMRSKFSKSFRYPAGTVSDQCYLYAKATRRNPDGFRIVKNAKVLFHPVSTFMDWRLLGVRSVKGDKEDLVKHFGKKILSEITIPKHLVYTSVLKWFLKDPINTVGSVIMNIYIRKFPYKKMSLKKGIWETTMSAKAAIPVHL